ncbi:MAG: hypothetical protein HYY95_02895, partial [Candidatus Rokubacteria bacterium]|nr:hypothetical protein [Candidatus Rokubacteria bacterium]
FVSLYPDQVGADVALTGGAVGSATITATLVGQTATMTATVVQPTFEFADVPDLLVGTALFRVRTRDDRAV